MWYSSRGVPRGSGEGGRGGEGKRKGKCMCVKKGLSV